MSDLKSLQPFDDPNKNFLYETNLMAINTLGDAMAANRLFPRDKIEWYDKVSRYGYIDPFSVDQICKEFLFFTKPDLNIFETSSNTKIELQGNLKTSPFFKDAKNRNINALRQLQYSFPDDYGKKNPFMYLLTNAVTSKLDLPSITSESKESTSNIMGAAIQYRGHSLKSDYGYDFSLSFTDTSSLEVYTLVKAYDEYIRMLKIGEISPKKEYIVSKILSEQFSIYKFLIGSDGETIIFYAKLTGCYFSDVPRSDFSDPGQDGFKFSVSFHAQFIEDNNPAILSEFNKITLAKSSGPFLSVYNNSLGCINNMWGRFPRIVKESDGRSKLRGVNEDYRLVWTE